MPGHNTLADLPAAHTRAGSAVWWLCAALVLIVTFASDHAAARIYKTYDADGNVVYTDQPPSPGEKGETIELIGGNTYKNDAASGKPGQTPTTDSNGRDLWLVDPDSGATVPDAPPADPTAGNLPDDNATPPPVAYRSISIISPTNNENIRANNGDFVVSVEVTPKLATGHRMRVLLDSTPVTGSEGLFQVKNADRGQHTLVAQVVNATGSVLITSSATVVHVKRVSVLTRPNRRTSSN